MLLRGACEIGPCLYYRWEWNHRSFGASGLQNGKKGRARSPSASPIPCVAVAPSQIQLPNTTDLKH